MAMILTSQLQTPLFLKKQIKIQLNNLLNYSYNEPYVKQFK